MLKRTLAHPRILITAFFVIASLLFVLTKIFLDTGIEKRILDVSVLALFVLWGIILVREVGHEVEARKRMEEVTLILTKANEQLHVLDRQRTEFLSIVSHQLRTPLTAIKGYTAMMLEGSFGKIPHSALQAIDRVFQSSEHLVHIVDDLLNVSRIEQGKMRYDFEAVDLSRIAMDVVAELSPIARAKKIKLSVADIDKHIPYVKADQNRIRQAITNLVDNAIKYTIDGGIRITVKSGNDEKSVVLSISDTGIGMDKKIQKDLFKKFFRGEPGLRTNARGSGLGLYVAQQIVKAHKGRLWAESDGVGKGSAFHLELKVV